MHQLPLEIWFNLSGRRRARARKWFLPILLMFQRFLSKGRISLKVNGKRIKMITIASVGKVSESSANHETSIPSQLL